MVAAFCAVIFASLASASLEFLGLLRLLDVRHRVAHSLGRSGRGLGLVALLGS
jgi:hypothetical protein